MTRGDRLTLTVEKPAAGGRMIARHNGVIALVSAAIPGETVEAVVEKIQRNTIWASTTKVIEASPDRIDPGPDWSCGGSVFAHIRYERQIALKRDIVRDAFSRLAHLPVPGDIPVAGSRVDGYRMRARLHFRQGKLGFFREGTHTLCDAGATRQLLAATLDALGALEQALQRAPDRTITDVEISENCRGDERACHLDLIQGADASRLGSLPEVEGFAGLSCAEEHNPHTLTLWGTPVVHDTLNVSSAQGDVTMPLSRHARAFFQGNRYLLQDLVTTVVHLVPSGRVLDLYAGVGLFAVAVATRGDSTVIAVEADRTSADDLKRNAAPVHERIEARHQSVETFLTVERRLRVDTAIIDPPRTGISKPAITGIISAAPPRIVYVSCDIATLARDARLLVDSGYHLQQLQLFDLFPNTAHVETVAVFDR